MSFFYNRQYETNQPLALPHGYTYNSNIETPPQTNHQHFINAQSPPKEIIIPSQPIDNTTPHRNRIFQQVPETKKELIQTRYKSTPGKRHRIFDKDVDLNKSITNNNDIKYLSNNGIQQQLKQQIEITKRKAQLYSGSFQQLLQKLISILEVKQDRSNLQLDPEFNDTIFKIRTLQDLDISDKIQIEKITAQILNQNEKLQFQELVKEIIDKDWMYWMEPLYYDVQKQQVPKEQWRQFIQNQKQQM